MVSTNTQGVAIAGDNPNVQFGVGCLQATGKGRCSSVNGMETIGIHVVRKAARATDTANENMVLSSYR